MQLTERMEGSPGTCVSISDRSESSECPSIAIMRSAKPRIGSVDVGSTSIIPADP